MLETAKSRMPFRSTTLKSIEILGKIPKRPPGEYTKDLPTGRKRGSAWLIIWNKIFRPLIAESKARYVLTWYADSVVPPNAIRDFLDVFAIKTDAGWVGGANYRRYPRHNDLGSPRPLGYAKSKKVVEVDYIGHVWMSPSHVIAKTPIARAAPDMHYSMIRHMKKLGYKVYYQPRVFIQHVATDGVIHRTTPDWPPLIRNEPTSHYDDIFAKSSKYQIPARYSPYKVVWDKVLEKLPPECSVLDIGCGPGQFATLCTEAGHPYVGVDFSKVAIARGRQVVPEATFHLVDVVKDRSLLTKGDYDVATFIEFLEHIDEDLSILESVPEGKRVVLTIPKYWGTGHIRGFRTLEEAKIRYGRVLDIESLDSIAFGDVKGRKYSSDSPSAKGAWVIYILSGTRQSG